MGLNIKNSEVEQLAADVAALAHETKTEAIRQALLERRARLVDQGDMESRRAKFDETMSRIWSQLPPEVLGKRISKEEREAILGFGPNGV